MLSNHFICVMDTHKHQLLTTKQVVEMLGISRSTLHRLIEAGVLKPVRFLARNLRFRLEDVEELANRTVSKDGGEKNFFTPS